MQSLGLDGGVLGKWKTICLWDDVYFSGLSIVIDGEMTFKSIL